MKNAMKWFGFTLLVLILTVALIGCSKPAPAPAPAKPTTPVAAKPAAAPTAKPAASPTAKPKASPTAPVAKPSSFDDFFSKQRVTLIVPYAAGGSSDYAGRIYASFWTEATGGSMVVKNVAGGGSVIGFEQLYAAKPDGATLGFAHAGGIVPFMLFQEPAPKFDAKKFNWLGYATYEPAFLIVPSKKPYQTVQDLQNAKGLKAPALGVYDRFTIMLGVLAEFLKLDMQIVPGFDSATDMGLAFSRGEVDFMIANSSYLGSIIRKGDYKTPLLAFQRERSPSYKDVPSLTEVVKPTGDLDKYLALAEGMFSGRAPIAPPGMDKAMVDYLRAKTKQMFALKAFVQQAKLQWPDWEEPWDGVKMQSEVQKALSVDRAQANAIVDKIVRTRLAAK